MPHLHEKVPRISPPSQAQLSLPNDRLCVYALGKDVAPRRGKLVVGAGETTCRGTPSSLTPS